MVPICKAALLSTCDCHSSAAAALSASRAGSHISGWPEFELEDLTAPPPVPVLYRTLVNAALHQLQSEGAVGEQESAVVSTGRVLIGKRVLSRNFDGLVLPLKLAEHDA